MPNQFYNRLNNLFDDDAEIDEVINYLENNVMPPGLDTNKKIRHFLTKFQGFIVENNKLYYQDTEHKLEVLKRADIDNKLRELYNNQDFSVGSGQTSLYFKVRDMYLNIKRNDVAEFLKKQPSYQMSRNTRHHINRPIRASQANERFVIDLIDVGEDYVDNGYRYILTCVDYFTRYVWCESLRTKTAVAVRDAMQTIVHRAGDTYPSIILSYNGGEFQGELLDWMREHNITHIKTLSYTPQSNGLVENMNGQIRKILREFMLRNRTLHWRQYLERATDIKNSQRNGTTKQFPNKVWRAGHIDRNGRIENRARRNIDIQIQKDIAKNKAPLYNNGDLVRVKMTALFSDLRKKVKEGKKKEIIVRYSPDVYRVKIWNRNFDAAREKQQYTLETLDNPPQPVLTEFKANNPNRVRGKKRFFATDFLKVNADDDQLENDYTMEEANRVNKIPNGTHLIRIHNNPNQIIPNPNQNPKREHPRRIGRRKNGTNT